MNVVHTVLILPAARKCVVFAKDHGTPRLLRRAPKWRHAYESGVSLGLKLTNHQLVRSVRPALFKKNSGPGGCSTKDECRAFYDEEGNTEICFAFAEEHTLMSPEDLEAGAL